MPAPCRKRENVIPQPRKVAATLLATATLALTAAACGSADSGDTATAVQTAPNGDVIDTADVQFATNMIPHHAQAVQMVVMTQGRPLEPAVQKLADSIRDAQVPEVETMSGWLTDWEKEVPATSLDHTNGGHDMHGMGGMSADDMPGMMTSEEMDQLENASDADFQDLWLTMMIKHHEGAIDMARTEIAEGRFTDAIELAKSMQSSQQDEILAMKTLLGS
jgi:uncharacterized protein (DUF305 family)